MSNPYQPGLRKNVQFCTILDMLDLLAQNTPSFMDRLSEEVRERVARAGAIVHYQDGQLIHNRGDEKPGISIVVSGAVQVGVYGADGTFVMTSNLGPGQTFGEFTLFADLPRTHDITAAGDTYINQISARAFERLYESTPEISRQSRSSVALVAFAIPLCLALTRICNKPRIWSLVLSGIQSVIFLL